jgi:Helicase HerA, central domain
VSVTGSKAIVLLDAANEGGAQLPHQRPEMGTLLAIEQSRTVVLAIVSALSVPVPAQREGESEIWIAELGLVGELWKARDGKSGSFNRGVTIYPLLGDRVRVATKPELELAFCGDMKNAVRVGCIRQDQSIPSMVRVDDLLGKHFAILGTTGTGKSCTTALILRAILEKNPAAHIVLLDPHNEYSTAFTEWGEVISPRNMQLPYWLLTFEELVEVLLGATDGRKAEIEILQELIPISKSRYSSGREKTNATLRRGVLDPGRFTVDTPVPYRISDLTSLIDERMGKLENKKDLHPYRQLRTRLDMITQDARYAFMFGQLTVYDSMAQILGRLFRVPVNNKPITILELTGLPTEIVNVVVSVICRLTFDFALWGEGHVPVTLVCEEAHRYVPANPNAGFEPCKRAIAKIAKEGRKYGASLCIVTQRPATPSLRCACPTTATRRSCRRPCPIPAPGCSSSCPPWASARRSPSATASPCRCASSSTNWPSTTCRGPRRPASARNGRTRSATKTSWSRSSNAGARPAPAPGWIRMPRWRCSPKRWGSRAPAKPKSPLRSRRFPPGSFPSANCRCSPTSGRARFCAPVRSSNKRLRDRTRFRTWDRTVRSQVRAVRRPVPCCDASRLHRRQAGDCAATRHLHRNQPSLRRRARRCASACCNGHRPASPIWERGERICLACAFIRLSCDHASCYQWG